MVPRPWAGVFVSAVLTLGSIAPASAAEDLFAALGAKRLVTPRATPDLALPFQHPARGLSHNQQQSQE